MLVKTAACSPPWAILLMGRMARPSGATLNELFATLVNWNACLADVPSDLLADPAATRGPPKPNPMT